MASHRLFLFAAAATLAACTSQPAVYPSEAFSTESPYEAKFEYKPDAVCEAGRRALLSQGYMLEEGRLGNSVKGSKAFQPAAELHQRLDITLVCLPASEGAVMYANALQTRYTLKTGGGAGLSINALGSISVPWGGNAENLVKVGEETVSDEAFYSRFFALVNSFVQ